MALYHTRTEPGENIDPIEAESASAAIDTYWEDYGYGFDRPTADEGTYWVSVKACPVEDEHWVCGAECRRRKVAIDPEEPECECDDSECRCENAHDWRDWSGPYGHGGGVFYSERCSHCGWVRHIDSWAQDMSDGEQGLRSTRYTRRQDEEHRDD